VHLDRFDERTDALWARVRGEYDIAGERTAELRNWRYTDRRSGPASILAIVYCDEVFGVIVAKRDGDTLRIFDLFTDPQHPGVGAVLLHVAVVRAKSTGPPGLVLAASGPSRGGVAASGGVPRHRGVGGGRV